MKKKLYLPIGLMLMTMPLSAQDIYKLETLTGTDLNGTARYVGMGGAMNALGADLSTMATNPAGIGMYRRSDVSMTGSVSVQPDAIDFCNINKARASFDQMGFVYAARMGEGVEFINFGLNYHKRRNMKNFIGVNNFQTHGLSQSLEMLDLSFLNGGWLDLSLDKDRNSTTPLTCLGYDAQMIAPTYDEDGNLTGYEPSSAEAYNYKRAQWGGINQFDFNISTNWNNQIYAGMTIGVQDVEINSGTLYNEMLSDNAGNLHPYYMTNDERISGTGVDVKFGCIIRPIETSPFRIGFAFHTPTFYDLNTDSYLYMNSPYQDKHAEFTERDVDVVGNEYNVRTPWKFNISMATTVANVLALDAEYEYCDYSYARVKYDYNGDYYYENIWGGKTDYALKQEAKRFLKPVSTFKVGAEAKLADNVFFRAGYNYVSAPIDKDAFLNLFTNSSSYYYNTNTDYVNLGEIQRATCGLGFKSKHFYADIAYQFQKQQGDLYTFHVPEMNSEANRLEAAKVDLNRHNIMLTLGYKF